MFMKRFLLFSLVFILAAPLFSQSNKIKELPAPQREGGMPLMEALDSRHSTRSYQEKDLPEQVLSNLLWAGFGENRESGKRTAPSSQNKQEMEIWVATKDGLYLYMADQHALKLMVDKDIRAKTGNQDFVDVAPINLVYVANYNKAGDVNPEEYKFTSGINTGFIAQNVYLYCASEGLASVVRGWYNEQELTRAMQLEDHRDIILTQTVGYPKE